MDWFALLGLAALLSWITSLVCVIVFLEMRRAARIKKGVPVEGASPPGFELGTAEGEPFMRREPVRKKEGDA